MASGIWSQILHASMPKHLCVRKLFIGKIYYTLNIQGVYLCRVIISNDENYSVGVGRASIKQVIVLWISDDLRITLSSLSKRSETRGNNKVSRQRVS